MNIFATHEEKALKALDEATGRHALTLAEIEAHRLSPADPGDFEAIRAWNEREVALARDLEIATGVIQHWRGVVAKHQEEAAAKAADAEHEALKKAAIEHEKLVREIAADAAKLAKKRDRLAAHVEAIAEYNARRGDLPPIADAETRIRQRPGRTRPAITETVKAYFDRDGNRFGHDIAYDEHGMTYRRRDLELREVVDVLHEERQDPPHMPTRYADAIKLVDIEGRPL